MTVLLRQPDVSKKFGISRPHLYEWMQAGLFPRPVKLSHKFAAWPSDECETIMNARIAGQSLDDLRKLVSELTEQRKQRIGG